MKRTNRAKEQRFDELLIAKIIAAAEESGVEVGTSSSGFGLTDRYNGTARFYVPDNETGPVCALGAGVLYKKIATKDGNVSSDFARLHRVSKNYANGVNDGFEDIDGAPRRGFGRITGDARIDLSSRDYERGVAVGEAIRAWAEDS